MCCFSCVCADEGPYTAYDQLANDKTVNGKGCCHKEYAHLRYRADTSNVSTAM